MSDDEDATQLVKVPVREFAAKFRNKKEARGWLTSKCNAYLPHHIHLNWVWLRQINKGKKKVSVLLTLLTVVANSF